VFHVLPLTRDLLAAADGDTTGAQQEDTKGQLLVIPPKKAPDGSVPQETFALRVGPRPEDGLLALCNGELADEYLRLADGFGLTSPQIEAVRLRHLLAAQGTTLYDRSRVKEYLDRKCGGEFVRPAKPTTGDRATATWGWRPLRPQDVRSNVKTGLRSLPLRSDEILETRDVYDKPLPLEVLKTAVCIQQQFPHGRFFASDRLRSRERNPLHEKPSARETSLDNFFLAVQLSAQGELLIVETWCAIGEGILADTDQHEAPITALGYDFESAEAERPGEASREDSKSFRSPISDF
jgi:hypothetical protein